MTCKNCGRRVTTSKLRKHIWGGDPMICWKCRDAFTKHYAKRVAIEQAFTAKKKGMGL